LHLLTKAHKFARSLTNLHLTSQSAVRKRRTYQQCPRIYLNNDSAQERSPEFWLAIT
uniref:Uncharacterized protein n=1 Tax=Ascaris lumbricoides TaxID=6252 RepID=A0A0M3HSJ9_ASCLU